MFTGLKMDECRRWKRVSEVEWSGADDRSDEENRDGWVSKAVRGV